jgi:hypothetical protein
LIAANNPEKPNGGAKIIHNRKSAKLHAFASWLASKKCRDVQPRRRRRHAILKTGTTTDAASAF